MSSLPVSSALQLPSSTSGGALASGMGFNTLPPLPIISTIFRFLTCLDLRTVGIDQGVVSRWFGWELAFFKVDLAQTGHEGVCESGEALAGGDGCLNPIPRGVPDLGKSGTGPKPISESGEAGAGPAPVFIELLDDRFVNLDQVEDVGEGDSPGPLLKSFT